MSRSSITRSPTPRTSAAPGRAPAKVREAAPSRGGKPHSIRIIGGDWKRTPLPVLISTACVRRPIGSARRFSTGSASSSTASVVSICSPAAARSVSRRRRAARRVSLMVERSGRAVAQLKANQTRLAAKNIEIVEADALRLAANLAPNSFDVVFLDPPFGDKPMLQRALELAVPLVAPGGALYVESGEHCDPSADARAGRLANRARRQGGRGPLSFAAARK